MLTGYLGADPEMRFTPQGSPVTTFRVASGRSWRSADGTQHDDTEWFRVVAWEKLAEICNQYLTKGMRRVYVEGRLQTRKYTDRDGQERYSTEVIATDMIILSSKRGEDGGDDGSYQGISGGNYGDEPMTKSAPSRGAASPTVPSRTPPSPPRNRPARYRQVVMMSLIRHPRRVQLVQQVAVLRRASLPLRRCPMTILICHFNFCDCSTPDEDSSRG
jgi:single-strand DNA-binding protein